MTNNPLINFLSELLKRFATKSPKFFKIWQWISGVLAAVTGIPEVLKFFGATLPEPFATLANKAIASAASGVLFMSLLTTQSKPAAITDTGEVLKKTDADRLPFTARNEEKQMEKSKAVIDIVEKTGAQTTANDVPQIGDGK